jgi:hypothetical protein
MISEHIENRPYALILWLINLEIFFKIFKIIYRTLYICLNTKYNNLYCTQILLQVQICELCIKNNLKTL